MKLETTTWFRTILVLAVLFCIGYGICLLSRDDEIAKTLSGIALISTGVFCFVWSLFPASSGICDIRRTAAINKILSVTGYVLALILLAIGIVLLTRPEEFIAGHLVCGLGFACWSTATVATAVARFRKTDASDADRNDDSSSQQKLWLEIFAAFPVLATWTWPILLLSGSADSFFYIAGHIMGAIACICTALLVSFAAVLRQKPNTYLRFIAFAAILWGVLQFALQYGQPNDFVGFLLIGSGIVCWSLSFPIGASIVPVHTDERRSDSITLFPFVLFIISLLMSIFLFEEAELAAKFLFPARMFLGFAAICLTAFAVTGILQIKTRSKA